MGSEALAAPGRAWERLRRRHILAVLAALMLTGPAALAQQPPAIDGMIIRRVEIEGRKAINEGFIRNLLKTRAGEPYAHTTVEDDVRELLRSRKFIGASATSHIEDNQAVVTFTVQEKPTITAVELEGNKKIPDRTLYELTPTAGEVLDRYAVNKGREDILQKYREKGYYYAQVELDERALAQENRVVYRINEGPRVKVRKILFEGVRSFPEFRLRLKLQTKPYIWIFRTGAFDEEQAERDALTLLQFYRDEGFLDARVGYRLEFSEVSRSDLNVVFVVEEGLRYRIGEIAIEGNSIFSYETLRAQMHLQPGDVLKDEALQEDRKRVQDAYGSFGYVDTTVTTRPDFTDQPGIVRLRYLVSEGSQSRFGRITIRGNTRTKDEVIRRELRFYPGELYDTVKARRAEQRIVETSLFSKATITPLNEIEGEREALVDVTEAEETVKFLVGVGVSTDNGVIGTFTLEDRNFDLFDPPRSWGEFFRGRSFHGDGQRLRLQAEPGTEVSRFRIDWTEPYLFDKPLRYDASFYLFNRGRDGYTEQRLGYQTSLSKRFEGGILDSWAIEGSLRLEAVDIDDVDALAARDIREVKGDSYLSAVRGAIVRDTTDSRIVPSQGYRLVFSYEQVGALGGPYTFGKPSVSGVYYHTVSTDIFDRKSVLALRADAGWIVGDAPVFERYYAGGFGSIRGFSYRGVSPRAGLYENRVGGDFILLTGGEYSFPLYSKLVRGVTFLDMGTVEKDFTITGWRASVGFGLRVQVDFFGPVPIVLDFGFPIAKDDDDDTRLFNFAFGASF